MKTKGSFLLNRASLWAIGSLAALLAVGTPAFAQHSGGGGGHGGGGGGGAHFSGGGGHTSGFGGGGHTSGFAGGAHGFAGGPRGYVGGGVHYAPRAGYGYAGRGYVGGSVSSVRSYGHVGGFAGRPGYGYGYGRGGFGYNRAYWGGGYWHGGYWPRAYYGWSYPWFLGVLPAVYATYWWGGIPYYYANDVYYTWNAGQNGYVVTDPPPVDTGDSDSAGGNGNYASAEPGQADAGVSSNVYAYPKSGQSDEQQSTDRYECHKWAVAQSGFDPTHTSGGSGNSADYRRAMTACLDGRGYSAQ